MRFILMYYLNKNYVTDEQQKRTPNGVLRKIKNLIITFYIPDT